MDKISKAIYLLLVVVMFSIITTSILWALEMFVLASIIGTGTITGLLLLVVLITAQITRQQTIETMKEGATIALQAQHINDSWDAKKAKVFGDILREGARLGKQHANHNEPHLPLLLPSQDAEWLPDMMEFDDVIDIEETE
jgi:hypothetical protein